MLPHRKLPIKPDGLLVSVEPAQISDVLNPLPETCTMVPRGPEVGLSVIVGCSVTITAPLVKNAEAEVGVVSVTFMVYNPFGGIGPTVNDPATVQSTPETAQIGTVARELPTPSSTMHPPAVPKPDPVMATPVPAGAETGFRTIRGRILTTFEAASAGNPEFPVAVIVGDPNLDPEATTN
jgi:hypothetical protein